MRNVRVVDDTTTFVANPHVAESDDFGVSARWSKALTGVLSNLTAGADFRRIDGSDEQIATAAVVDGATLITRNVKEFSRLPDLRVISY